MPTDPKQTEAYLRSLNASDRARAAAFDAVYNMDDAAAQRVLSQLPFSDDVRAELWDIRNGGTVSGGTPFKPANPADFTDAASAPEGSAAGRFVSGAAKMLNPITIAGGLVHSVAHPINTATGLYQAQADQFRKAGDAQTVWERGGHLAAGVLPILGPVAANIGEDAAAGDVAGALGETAGLIAPIGAAGAMRLRVARQAQAGVPAVLEREAAQQVSQRVLAPGSVAFKGKAEAIAPEILKRGMKGGRPELAEAAEEGEAQAGQRIDDAINAGGGGQSGVVIDPIIGQLRRRIEDLSINGEPIKGAEGRVAGLKARIDQLERNARTQPRRAGLVQGGRVTPGPVKAMSFDDLRKVRDEQYRIANEAKAYQRMGNPALNDEGFAAKETGSAIRHEFGRLSPELAAANADYTFFKTLGDVLDPAQGRPKVTAPSQGVTGGAATSGAVVGQMVSPKAAFVLSVVRPWIQRMRSDPAWQLADAHAKMRLAEAIRNGDVTAAQKLMVRISEGAVVSSSPTGSQQGRAQAR